MNLDEIKQLANGGEKLVFIENGKVAGVFLSYEEYRKINCKKEEQKSMSTLPLSSLNSPNKKNMEVIKDTEIINEPLFQTSVQEPDMIIEAPIAQLTPETVKLEADLTAIKSDKELTVEDLPF